MVTQKEVDDRLGSLHAKLEAEAKEWEDEERRLYEFEESLLRDTVGEGNILMGWGEPRTAGVRFRNAGIRKRKRERRQLSHPNDPLPEEAPTPEEQLRIDKHRLASYSSVTSPGEEIFQTIRKRQQAQETQKDSSTKKTKR